MTSEPRELHPFVEYGPRNQVHGDFGAYPVPANTPEPAPKGVGPAVALYQDLVPTSQEVLPPPAAPALVEPPPSLFPDLDLTSIPRNGHSERAADQEFL